MNSIKKCSLKHLKGWLASGTKVIIYTEGINKPGLLFIVQSNSIQTYILESRLEASTFCLIASNCTTRKAEKKNCARE